MKRWLAALKAIDNMSEVSVEDKEKNNEQQHPSEEPRKQSLVSRLILTLECSPSVIFLLLP